MDRLKEILSDTRPDVDFDKEKALIDDGILDSFDVISIVSELNDELDIEIGAEDLTPENFNSIEALYALVSRLQSE